MSPSPDVGLGTGVPAGYFFSISFLQTAEQKSEFTVTSLLYFMFSSFQDMNVHAEIDLICLYLGVNLHL